MTDIDALIQKLAADPTKIHEISAMEFEQVVAELLAGFGWHVNLTAATRDGGYDVLGVCEDAPNLYSTWIVECKKYSPERPVGINILRSLYGIKHDLKSSNGVIITTSRFTRDARSFAAGNREIQLVDFDGIAAWLIQYRPSPNKTPYLLNRTFESCFISYSKADEEFAEFLFQQLRQNGVGVWFAQEDVLPGEKLHDQIKRAIRTFDRLLIVLSEASMKSEWVKTEIRTARKRELNEGRRVLFPIGLVSYERIKEWECFDADTGKDLAVEIREYPIPDLSNWRNTESFAEQFNKLLKGLSTNAGNA